MNVQLLPLSADLLVRLAEDPVRALQGAAKIASKNFVWLKEVCAMSRDFYQRVGAKPPWTGYLAMDRGSGEVVGTCGFKGNPNAAGEVEISYGTFRTCESRGVASAMAQRLTAIALEQPVIRRVLAHTLPERNASCRVLEKAGYQFAGEVIDPEDGQVWRWERARS